MGGNQIVSHGVKTKQMKSYKTLAHEDLHEATEASSKEVQPSKKVQQKKAKVSVAPQKFNKGMHVQIFDEKKGSWAKGKVKKYNGQDGTYDIRLNEKGTDG